MKVDVARGIDQIELIELVFELITHLDRAGFNGDASLAFQVQIIQQLFFHFSFGHRAGKLQQPVGQRAFPVIDVGDDAKVAYVLSHIDFCK
jgi:hypothetical protein